VDLALALDQDVLAAQAGDREAFTRLVDAYRNVVTSIVTAILRDVTASEDVAQEVFLSAWQGLGKLRNPASFLPWLRQLTRNQAHHFVRGRARYRRRHDQTDIEDDLLATAADPRPIASEKLISDEEKQVLAEVMEQLPDEAREIITLYYREGRSARQVADLLGIREDAVKKRLERARSVLRHEMLDRFGDVVKRTAPGAAFTAAVAAGLTVGIPGTAAAATTAAVGSGAIVKVLGKVAIGFSGLGLGLFGGLGGIILNLRSRSRLARDDQERRELRSYAKSTGIMIVVFCLGVQASAMLRSPALLIGLWIVMLSCHGYLHLKKLPQISRRRHAAERAEDPDAWRRHRRELRKSKVGFLFGATFGTAGVVYATYVLMQAG
jgi:RNA polymerase sigma factor (sigma-70 family)